MVKGHRININVKLAKVDLSETGEPTPTPTTAETATSSGTNTATPAAHRRVETSGPTVTITSTKFFQNGKEVLRIRSTPSANGKEVGFAEVGNSYPYLGEQQAGWYKIDFNGQTGWASGQYAHLD